MWNNLLKFPPNWCSRYWDIGIRITVYFSRPGVRYIVIRRKTTDSFFFVQSASVLGYFGRDLISCTHPGLTAKRDYREMRDTGPSAMSITQRRMLLVALRSLPPTTALLTSLVSFSGRLAAQCQLSSYWGSRITSTPVHRAGATINANWSVIDRERYTVTSFPLRFHFPSLSWRHLPDNSVRTLGGKTGVRFYRFYLSIRSR